MRSRSRLLLLVLLACLAAAAPAFAQDGGGGGSNGGSGGSSGSDGAPGNSDEDDWRDKHPVLRDEPGSAREAYEESHATPRPPPARSIAPRTTSAARPASDDDDDGDENDEAVASTAATAAPSTPVIDMDLDALPRNETDPSVVEGTDAASDGSTRMLLGATLVAALIGMALFVMSRRRPA